MSEQNIVVLMIVGVPILCVLTWAVVRQLRIEKQRDSALWISELAPGAFSHEVTLASPATGLFFDIDVTSTKEFDSEAAQPHPKDFWNGDWRVTGARVSLRVASANQVFLNVQLRVPLDLANCPDSSSCSRYERTLWLRSGISLPAGVALTIEGSMEVVPNTELKLLRMYLVNRPVVLGPSLT